MAQLLVRRLDEPGGTATRTDVADGVEVCDRPSHGRVAWRRCWSHLDEDVREHIVLHVDAGAPLLDEHWAALASVFARRRRRDAVAAMVAAPALTILAVAVGAAFGRATRGDEALAAFLRFLGWSGGLVWIVSAASVTALLLLATRDWRGRLRRAEHANRLVATR